MIDVVQSAVRAAKIARIATEPAHNVILVDIADSVGKYAVRYWLTDLAVDDPTDSEPQHPRLCISSTKYRRSSGDPP